MKTYNNLFDQISSVENVEAALYEAARGKRKKRSVIGALAHSREVAERISNQLREGAWKPVEIHTAREINDGVSRKKRIIVCPEFVREQIVHHAIMRVCGPLFQKKFYQYSCGSVPGKGKDTVVEYIAKKIKDRRSTKYYATLDIRKCYENIRPSVAFREIRRTISDKRVLKLFAMILRYNKVRMPDGTLKRNGLLMGMFTSPWIANILLNPLDHYIKEELGINVEVRYMDDIFLAHGNKRKLRNAIASVESFLAQRKLALKSTPAIHKIDDVPVRFLGVLFRRGKTTLTGELFLRITRIVSRIAKKPILNVHDAKRIVSYAGHFKHLDTRKAFMKYIGSKITIKKCRVMISRKERNRNVMETGGSK